MQHVHDLFGTADTARYTADHIPGARLVVYPTGGHLWVGHNDEALAEIVTFLEKIPVESYITTRRLKRPPRVAPSDSLR